MPLQSPKRQTYEEAITEFAMRHGFERERISAVDHGRCLTYAEQPIPRAQFRDDLLPKVRTRKVGALVSGRYVLLDARARG